MADYNQQQNRTGYQRPSQTQQQAQYQTQQSPARPIQTQPQIEQPIYVLPQNKKRAIIPKIIIFIVLGIIFYLGVLLNVSLLELDASTESIAKLTSLILLLLIILLGTYLTFHKAMQPYKFYRNRIYFNKKEIKYTLITNTNLKQDFWDKMFKTYSIGLSKKFFLRNIPQTIQINNYLNQLINYAKSQQQRL
ncbi:hypothetical protein HON71_02295 [Candidatus Woesearchaeota archaeon]|nr:hypothetical protein [Candidatus Woesearchaeota archaeon]MBT5342790.1 hypothetical protein [Candidatus Woesearchaeota archaeon]